MEYNKGKTYTLSILVKNKSGVLMRVVSLFSRRGYNIDSLSVGTTENPEYSRITVQVPGDRQIVEQIKGQVEKLVDVIRVYEMTQQGSVKAELILVKLKANDQNRSDIIGLGEIFKAKISDVTPETITLQIVGNRDKLESFLEMANHYGIVELARTGMTALERGSRALSQISLSEKETIE